MVPGGEDRFGKEEARKAPALEFARQAEIEDLRHGGKVGEVKFEKASRRAIDIKDRKLTEAGVDLSKPVVTSCGSGITAAVITLALETLGHQDNKLYDGSWSEWGGRSDTPIVTGPPANGKD